jgi:hypothetical protein
MAEWDRLPLGMLESILEYRDWAAVKADYTRDPKPRAGESALRSLVRQIDFEIAQQEIATRD